MTCVAFNWLSETQETGWEGEQRAEGWEEKESSFRKRLWDSPVIIFVGSLTFASRA